MTARLPGDEHVERFDTRPIDFASFVAYRKSQRPAAERAPSPDLLNNESDERIKAEIAARTAKRDAGQLTKADLKPLLDQDHDYDTVKRWTMRLFMAFCIQCQGQRRRRRTIRRFRDVIKFIMTMKDSHSRTKTLRQAARSRRSCSLLILWLQHWTLCRPTTQVLGSRTTCMSL